MAYENLDAQDKEICEAMEAGEEGAAIMEKFGVDEAKLTSLRNVVAEEKARKEKEEGEKGGGEGEKPKEEAGKE